MKKFVCSIVFCLFLFVGQGFANGIDLFGGVFKLGIAAWGFSQKNAYGNVTGSIFALTGTIQIIQIRW